MTEYLMKFIKQNVDKSDSELKVIKYGISLVSMTLYKLLLIAILSVLLGNAKETFMMFVFFGFVRTFSFGLHAKHWFACTVYSVAVFVFLPYLLKDIILTPVVIIILTVISMFLFFLYAPSDTINRPIRSVLKRKRFKLISLMIALIYFILSMTFHSQLSTFLSFGSFVAAALTTPAAYKLAGVTKYTKQH